VIVSLEMPEQQSRARAPLVRRPKPVKPTGQGDHVSAGQEEQTHFGPQFLQREPRASDQPAYVLHEFPCKSLPMRPLSKLSLS
jgi:hypothetical protein